MLYYLKLISMEFQVMCREVAVVTQKEGTTVSI